MSEEIRDRDVVLAMDTQEPIIAEMDNDVALEIDTPNDIEITLEQPEVIVQELSGDNAIGMIAGSLSTFAKEKTLTDGIASIEDKLDNLNVDVDLTPVAKESTLLSESQSIKDKIDNIEIPTTDLSSVAKEATLTQGISEIKSAVTNIDLSTVAKEATLTSGVNELKTAVANIDLSYVESKVEEESQAIQGKIDNIKLPEIDTTELAKQGENQEATNSKILEEVQKIPDLKNIYSARFEKNDDGEDTYSMVLPIVAGVIANEDGETVTIKL